MAPFNGLGQLAGLRRRVRRQRGGAHVRRVRAERQPGAAGMVLPVLCSVHRDPLRWRVARVRGGRRGAALGGAGAQLRAHPAGQPRGARRDGGGGHLPLRVRGVRADGRGAGAVLRAAARGLAGRGAGGAAGGVRRRGVRRGEDHGAHQAAERDTANVIYFTGEADHGNCRKVNSFL
jgi:hypothetical protein